jgi:RimJ/RimL family protein N-acetyltransferase
MSGTVTLRPATLQDEGLLLKWRNNPMTRNASHNTAEVQRDEQISWLSQTLSNPNRKLFIAEENGVSVGTVRAIISEGVWELSWTVPPNERGRGVAKRMVALLAHEIYEPIRAEVKVGNIASTRIAEHAVYGTRPRDWRCSSLLASSIEIDKTLTIPSTGFACR